MPETDSVSLAFPPRPEHVALARVIAGRLAESVGIADDVVQDILLVVSEAVTNAVRAHLAKGIDDSIEIVCSAGDTFLLEVHDLGGGFEAGRHPFPVRADGADGGFGVPLMQVISDRTEIVRNAKGGTTVRLAIQVEAAAERT